MALLEETSRVAFAALIHDLGKFAQRADIQAGKDRIETHKQWYCPPKRQSTPPYLPLNGYTHVHAAYTALGFDAIEKACGFDLRGDQSPFEPTNTRTPDTDSLVNAAARHHKPETLLQWIVATADRVASGFERDKKLPAEEEEDGPDRRTSFLTRRKVSLLEEIRLDQPFKGDLQYRKPLKPFSVQSLFPKLKKEAEPTNKQQAVEQYRGLWDGFLEGCRKLGDRNFQDAWPMWLDAFDTLWLTYTESIPSATVFGARSDVSLYDHSKATAALAAALWRWCKSEGRSDKELIADLRSVQGWDKESLLLIQGDFFGIQNFIFSSGSQTDAKSAKILRGRSFYVSLLTEACALRILEALDLPPTSQITNAAGKFLIVAPNTEDVRERLDAVRGEVDAWFLEHTFAESGIGIAAKRATLSSLVEKKFPALIKSLFAELEVAKLHRFDLFGEGEHPQVLPADFSKGVCAWQGRWPADKMEDGLASCAVSRDEIRIGEALVKNDLLLLIRDEDERPLPGTALELPLFGYKAVFAGDETFRQIRLKTDVRRVWDFSMPEKEDEVLWKGFARRSINGFVPRVPEDVNPENHLTYRGLDPKDLGGERIEPFSWIARENLFFDEKDQPRGVEALCHLKGDVDQLGRIFQEGLVDKENETQAGVSRNQPQPRRMNFAKMASLSREMNAFFSVYAPWLCSHQYPKIYTVFAGGDDFSFIGPWKQTQDFATELQQRFKDFTAQNAEVHFSAGMTVVKSGMPVRVGSEMAEEALSTAKSSGRDSVSIYGECMKWTEWKDLQKIQNNLEDARERYSLSTSYLYSLFHILELSREEKEGDPQASIWRSRFYYRTTRLAEELRHASREEEAKALLAEMPDIVLQALEKHGGRFRVPLTNLFYRCRRMRS